MDSSSLVNCDLECTEIVELELDTSSWLQEGEEGDDSLSPSSSKCIMELTSSHLLAGRLLKKYSKFSAFHVEMRVVTTRMIIRHGRRKIRRDELVRREITK